MKPYRQPVYPDETSSYVKVSEDYPPVAKSAGALRYFEIRMIQTDITHSSTG
jgi:hypothetical protein